MIGHENYYNNYLYMYSRKTNEVFEGKTTLRNYTELINLSLLIHWFMQMAGSR